MKLRVLILGYGEMGHATCDGISAGEKVGCWDW